MCAAEAVKRLCRDGDLERKMGQRLPSGSWSGFQQGLAVLLWDLDTLRGHQPQARPLGDQAPVRHSKVTSQLCLGPD